MNLAEYTFTRDQMYTVASMVFEMRLDKFLSTSRSALISGPKSNPVEFEIAREKLELSVKLATKLREFQSLIPTLAEAKAMDDRADRQRVELGL